MLAFLIVAVFGLVVFALAVRSLSRRPSAPTNPDWSGSEIPMPLFGTDTADSNPPMATGEHPPHRHPHHYSGDLCDQHGHGHHSHSNSCGQSGHTHHHSSHCHDTGGSHSIDTSVPDNSSHHHQD